jgi:hypothetical protein
MVDRDKFIRDAKMYIEQIYASHREQDIEAWNELICILFLYVDELIKYHHPEEK